MKRNRQLFAVQGRSFFPRRLGLMVLSLVAIAALAGAPPASRAEPVATINVTITIDEYNTTGTGTGCSLREAVQAANDSSAFGGCPGGGVSPVIELPAGTYTLTRTGAGDNTNATGDLDLNADITINGAGQATTIIDASALQDRAMHILLGRTVVLNDLTITGGHASDGLPGADGVGDGASGDPGSKGQDGGGILNFSSLTLNNCTIKENHAGNGGVGGQGQPGTAGNTSGDGGNGGLGGNGGGIYNSGAASLSLDGCTLSGNAAGDGGAGAPGQPGPNGVNGGAEFGGDGGDGGYAGEGGHGGGIHNADGATLALDGCTLSGNMAGSGGLGGSGGNGGDGAGGGTNPNPYAGDGGDGSENGEGGDGGGIYNATGATTTLQNCTLRDNQAGPGGAGGAGGNSGTPGPGGDGGSGGEGSDGSYGGDGGGIASTGTMTVTASSILNNRAGPGGNAGHGGNGGSGANGTSGDAGHGLEGGDAGEGSNGGDGGGIAHTGASTLLFTSGTIAGNRAGDGGLGGNGGPGGNGGNGTSGGSSGRGAQGGDGGHGGSAGKGGGLYLQNATLVESTIRDNHSGQGGHGGDGAVGGTGGTGGSGQVGGDGGHGGDGGDAGPGGPGGGFHKYGMVTLDTCTVSLNTAGIGGDGGSAAMGGAGGAGSSNPAASGGEGGNGGDGGRGGHGGIGGAIRGTSTDLTILTSTIHGNTSGDGGQSVPGANGGAGGPPGPGSATALPGANGDGGDGGGGGNGGSGGGLYLSSPTELEDSTISGNQSGNGSAASDGGNAGSNTSSAEGRGGEGSGGGRGGTGGGIHNTDVITATNCTISGNSVGQGADGGSDGTGPEAQNQGGNAGDAGTGGGIYNHTSTNAHISVAYVTIANNRASGSGGQGGSGATPGDDGADGQGGGVHNLRTFSFARTILADNLATAAGPDCLGEMTSGGYNIIGKTADCTFVGLPGTDLTNKDPLLAPLGNNTGPTETHLPLPGSDAVDGYPSNKCYDANGNALFTDQRGRTRPIDGDHANGPECDIGAVEVQSYRALAATVTGAGQGNVVSTPAGIDCGDGVNDCLQSYDQGTEVTLEATADSLSRFTAWSGDCNSTAISCTVTMDTSKQVTATFDLIPSHTLTVELAGDGSGAVASDPAGIDCGTGAGCAHDYLEGTVVTLTAAANTGSHFMTWDGACTGTTTACQVTIAASETATATFALDKAYVYLPIVLKNRP